MKVKWEIKLNDSSSFQPEPWWRRIQHPKVWSMKWRERESCTSIELLWFIQNSSIKFACLFIWLELHKLNATRQQKPMAIEFINSDFPFETFLCFQTRMKSHAKSLCIEQSGRKSRKCKRWTDSRSDLSSITFTVEHKLVYQNHKRHTSWKTEGQRRVCIEPSARKSNRRMERNVVLLSTSFLNLTIDKTVASRESSSIFVENLCQLISC